MARFASFETQHLQLRPVNFEDSLAFFELARDEVNTQFIFPSVSDRAESDNLLVHSFLRAPLGNWGICLREKAELIGLIRLENLNSVQMTAELGYFIRKDYWGQGLVTEAVKNLLFLAFHELKLRSLTILCHEDNRASQRVAEKAGFTLVKKYRGSDRYSHKIRHYRMYQVKRGDYRYE